MDHIRWRRRLPALGGWTVTLFVLSMLCGAQEMTPDKIEQEFVKRVLTAGARANLWRLSMAEDVDRTMERSTDPDILNRWKKEVLAGYFEADDRNELRDFFSGAVTLVGPVSTGKVLAGFYNPWPDAVFLCIMADADNKPKVTDFAFISGETWRSETIQSPDDMFGWFKKTDPVLLAVSKVYSRTIEVFNERYPHTGALVLVTDDLKDRMGPQGEELAPIKVRTLSRMAMIRDMFSEENRPALTVMRNVLWLIAHKDVEAASDYLADDQDPGMVQAVYDLPDFLRESLAPIFYLEKDGRGVAALVSARMPRWCIQLDFDIGEGEITDPRVFVHDLELSKQYIELSEEGAQ